eukprot:6665695-Lingulodinium_polyedra.AAC.1
MLSLTDLARGDRRSHQCLLEFSSLAAPPRLHGGGVEICNPNEPSPCGFARVLCAVACSRRRVVVWSCCARAPAAGRVLEVLRF